MAHMKSSSDINVSSSEEEDMHSNSDPQECKIVKNEISCFDDLPSDDSIDLSSSSEDSEEDSLDDSEEDSLDDLKEDFMVDNGLSIEDRLESLRNKPLRRKKHLEKTREEVIAQLKNIGNRNEGEANSYPKKFKKKRSKHEPTEASSKKKDFYKNLRRNAELGNNGLGDSVLIKNKYKPRDPRMHSINGNFDVDAFEKKYSFLEEMEEKEIEKYKAQIGARKLPGAKGKKACKKLGLTHFSTSLQEDQENLSRLISQQKNRAHERHKRETKRMMKKSIHDAVKDGKQKPFYIKEKDFKRKLLEVKYDKLLQEGKDIDKVLGKKRQKNQKRISRKFY